MPTKEQLVARIDALEDEVDGLMDQLEIQEDKYKGELNKISAGEPSKQYREIIDIINCLVNPNADPRVRHELISTAIKVHDPYLYHRDMLGGLSPFSLGKP